MQQGCVASQYVCIARVNIGCENACLLFRSALEEARSAFGEWDLKIFYLGCV